MKNEFYFRLARRSYNLILKIEKISISHTIMKYFYVYGRGISQKKKQFQLKSRRSCEPAKREI